MCSKLCDFYDKNLLKLLLKIIQKNHKNSKKITKIPKNPKYWKWDPSEYAIIWNR